MERKAERKMERTRLLFSFCERRERERLQGGDNSSRLELGASEKFLMRGQERGGEVRVRRVRQGRKERETREEMCVVVCEQVFMS